MSAHVIDGKPVMLPRATFPWSRLRGLLTAGAIFAALCLAVDFMSATRLEYFDFLYISSGGLTLAITAVGLTVVIISGGFDLSAAAVVSLVNVLVATTLSDSISSQIGASLMGICVGAAIGALNGYMVAFLRLQSIVVTLATMFIASGLTLLWMKNPGGYVPASFSNFFVGSTVEGWLPAPVMVLAAVLAVWLLIKNTRFGTALYAVGSDQEAAEYSGTRVVLTRFFAFVIAGAFYGLAGVVITAQTSTGDPLLGQSMLLEVFAAVVLGGTVLSGGRGGCFGTIFGAYSLMLIVNILLVMNVPAFYSTIVQGAILLLAALGQSSITVKESLRWLRSFVHFGKRSTPGASALPLNKAAPSARPSWLVRDRQALAYIAPSYGLFVLVVIATAFLNGFIDKGYFNSLLLLSSFLVILALGQGTVILTGGLDLSVAWTIAFCGILFGELVKGGYSTTWVLPATLLVGFAIGALNGLFVHLFRLPAIVVTLAMNGVLQGAALVLTSGTPAGLAPEWLKWFMSGSSFGVTPVSIFVLVFIAAGMFLLGKTTFGRNVYAVGNNARVAFLSGVNVGTTIVLVFALSGLCSAIVGILLVGFSGRAILGMGDQYLLPSVAVVVIGGTLITGGRGRYIGMVGGVFLLISLQILLAGTTLAPSVRDIIFGMVVLAAVVALRERAYGT